MRKRNLVNKIKNEVIDSSRMLFLSKYHRLEYLKERFNLDEEKIAPTIQLNSHKKHVGIDYVKGGWNISIVEIKKHKGYVTTNEIKTLHVKRNIFKGKDIFDLLVNYNQIVQDEIKLIMSEIEKLLGEK